MRRLSIWLMLLALALGAGGWWVYQEWPRLTMEYACHRVASAGTFEEAQRELARLEVAKDRDAGLSILVQVWGTGNAKFDEYLARHVQSPRCGDTLREWFSLELGSRPGMLARWAHYWAWRKGDVQEQNPAAGAPGDELAAEIAALAEYLQTLDRAEPPRAITWREVLDVQAVFVLTGQEKLARRLKPDAWQERFRRWEQSRGDWPTEIVRPGRAFP